MNTSVFKILALLFSCSVLIMCANDNSNGDKSEQYTAENNYAEFSERDLQNNIIDKGDTLAYLELFNRNFKSDFEDMLIWAQILAYRYNSPLGYLEIYNIICNTYLLHGISFENIEPKTQNYLIDCLMKSSELGNPDAEKIINEIHPDLLKD